MPKTIAKRKERDKGIGTIVFRKDRSKPYRAKVCDGTKTDAKGRNQTVYRTIGSFRTKAEAEKALLGFSDNPYDLAGSVETFEDLYNKWFEYYSRTLKGPNSVRTITSAYTYCSGLYKMRIRDIGPGHIKDAMECGYIIVQRGPNSGEKRFASPCTKERIKSMCNMMFDYAVDHKILLYNPARASWLYENAGRTEYKSEHLRYNELLERLQNGYSKKPQEIADFIEHQEAQFL